MKNWFLLSFFILGATKILACSCVESGSVKDEFKRHDVVFTATVLEVLSPIEPIDTFWRDGEMYIRKPVFGYAKSLLVETVYKGKKLADTIIVSGVDNNCELYLKKGESYLIYGFLKGGQVETNACTRSGYVKGHQDLMYLEKKRKHRIRK